jgi:hypothetical protein
MVASMAIMNEASMIAATTNGRRTVTAAGAVDGLLMARSSGAGRKRTRQCARGALIRSAARIYT